MRSFLAVLVLSCGGVSPVSGGGSGGGSRGGGTEAPGGGAAAANGGGAVPSIDHEALSGSRLKNRYLEGDDGSRTPDNFYDSQRGENCAFVTAEDGEWRCLPIDEATSVSGAYFADSSCTTQATVTACGGAKYAYEVLPTCPARFAIYAVTPLAGPAYNQNGSTCIVANVTASLYRIGDKIAADSFVRATVKVEQ